MRKPTKPQILAEIKKNRPDRIGRAEQKQRSRNKLLDAARALCAEGRYMSCSVDDIARNAGLSRAGFYMHFTSKEELLTHLIENQIEWYLRQFRIVSPKRIRTEEGLLEWFHRFIERFDKVNELVSHFQFAIPIRDAYSRNQELRERAIETLGHRIPQLALFRADGSIDPERHYALFLFVYQLEVICLNVAFAPAAIPADRALRNLARYFLGLLRDETKIKR